MSPCDHFEDGSSFFPLDYRLSCDSPAYTTMKVYASVSVILVPLGIPLIYWYLLFQHRDAIKNRDRNDSSMDASIEFMRPIFEPYKGEYWYYEICDVTARIL